MGEKGDAKTRWCDYCCWVYPWHECKTIPMTPEEETEARSELEKVSASYRAELVFPTGVVDGHSGWYCGIWEWKTPAGWSVCVFNDCAEWDYLESITAPDGREWHYPFNETGNELRCMTKALADWKPTFENEPGWPHIGYCPP